MRGLAAGNEEQNRRLVSFQAQAWSASARAQTRAGFGTRPETREGLGHVRALEGFFVFRTPGRVNDAKELDFLFAGILQPLD